MPQDWHAEWDALLRRRDEAVVRARLLQAEISAALRRREPPARQLLRAADAAEGDLASARAQLKEFLRQLAANSV
jgi:ABC-type transporter Mla subunit MlaD